MQILSSFLSSTRNLQIVTTLIYKAIIIVLIQQNISWKVLHSIKFFFSQSLKFCPLTVLSSICNHWNLEIDAAKVAVEEEENEFIWMLSNVMIFSKS